MWLCPWLCLWHSMLFFRRKASRRVVCIVPYRRGACQPVSAEFRRHLLFSGAGGVPPCRGDCSGVAGAAGVGGALRGGRALFVACLPCLWFLILPPIPPTPFPSGEGGDQGYFHARGFAPCIPGAGWDTALALLVENRFLRLQMERWHPPGGGNPDCKKPLPLCICMAGFISAASGSVQGCRGRSPRRNKLWGSPFPAGEGGSGVYPSPSGKGGSKVN